MNIEIKSFEIYVIDADSKNRISIKKTKVKKKKSSKKIVKKNRHKKKRSFSIKKKKEIDLRFEINCIKFGK